MRCAMSREAVRRSHLTRKRHEARQCYLPASSADRNRVTVVPQTGQGPLAIGRPVDVSTTLPSEICRFSRHLTQ